MLTALPEPSPNASPDEHMQISRRFVQHAKEELARGERLQASEKIWGAAAHALKAVGKGRGWNTEEYARMRAIAYLLSDEFDDPQIRRWYDAFYGFHLNFYRNAEDEGSIAANIGDVEQFVNELESIRGQRPQPFTIADQYQINRLHQVDAVPRNPKIGETYTSGFINRYNLDEGRKQWEAQERGGGDDDISPEDDDADGAGSGGR